MDDAWLHDFSKSLRDWIQTHWRSYYPDQIGECPEVRLRSSRPVRLSVIMEFSLRFPSSGDRESIIVKIPRDSNQGEFRRAEVSSRAIELARSEFEELERAHDYFSQNSTDLAVVRPLDYVDEHNALLIERARGSDLEALVARGDPDLLRHLERAGRWLRLFHTEVHSLQEGSFDSAGYMEQIEMRAQELLALGVSHGTIAGLIGAVRTSLSGAKEWKIARTGLHGDYKLKHVWATSAGIQVLDLGTAYFGDRFRDVARFLVELEAYDLWNARLWNTKTGAYHKAFLNGYLAGETDTRSLQLWMVDFLMLKWKRRIRRWSTSPNLRSAQRRLERLGLKAVVDRHYLDRWFSKRILARLASR